MSTSLAGTSGAVLSSSAQQVMPVSPSKRSASGKRNSARIIRTFEEVEKTIFQEEWYEELECGICSNVLGAPQALVPCGHTFCGPCAWQWIKTNKNHTCPHCRMEVTEATPFVPNIVVEQIIERKLRAIADGEQKVDLMLERKEKSEAWRILQDTLPPSKQIKKGRGPIDELLSSIFDPAAAGTQHQRRASRHLMELGIAHGANRTGAGGRPSVLSQNGGPSLGDLRRLDAEEEAVRLMIAFRQRVRENREETASRTHQGLGPAAFVDPMANPDYRSARPEASRSASTNDIGRFGNPAGPLPYRFAPAQASTSSHGRSNLAGAEASQIAGGSSRPRPSRLTSQALLSRQARGRGGTRDAPLVVASDSEDD